MKISAMTSLCLWASASLLRGEASWPQWRGPDRNGVSTSEMKLANTWPEEGPKLLWESKYVPSGDDGGFGSVVATDGRVYLSVVWHRDVPTETRTVDNLVLR